jgi:hypothetical protein
LSLTPPQKAATFSKKERKKKKAFSSDLARLPDDWYTLRTDQKYLRE